MSTGQKAEAVVSAFVNAWNSHDMNALSRLFTEEAEFVNVYGTWKTGRNAIEELHAGAHTTVFRASRLSCVDYRITPLGEQVAGIHWRWTLTGLMAPDGSAIPDRQGIMVFVLQRSNENWEIAIAQNTDTVEPPG